MNNKVLKLGLSVAMLSSILLAGTGIQSIYAETVTSSRADAQYEEALNSWSNEVPVENLIAKGVNPLEANLAVEQMSIGSESMGSESMGSESMGSESMSTASTAPALQYEVPSEVLVTLDQKTAGFNHGHAAIIISADYNVEAFSSGVNYYYIGPWKWPTYAGAYNTVKAEWVALNDGGYPAQNFRDWAVGNAKSHVGKPYNTNFFDQYNTSKFYCSSLVWRAWKDSGIDIDGGWDSAVSPWDLHQDANTKEYYSRGSF